MRVWIEAWEWQCCGEPFAVGAEVEWGLLPVSADDRAYLIEPLGAAVAGDITHCETHHADEDGEQPVPTRGRVEAIEAAFSVVEAHGDNPQSYEPVPDSGAPEQRQSANGWEPEDRPGGKRYRTFSGYIVTLAPLG